MKGKPSFFGKFCCVAKPQNIPQWVKEENEMVTIRKNLCPESRYDLKCPYTRTPSRIVVHNTANDAPAEREIAYMVNRPEQVSFHFAVDDREAVQGLPLDRNAWASGDGRGVGNREGIHVEICYSLSGGERFQKAEQNAAKLIASLLKQYGWGVDKVTKHQDYDGKYCPHRTLDLGWQRFLDMVRKETEGEELNREETLKLINETMERANPTYHTLEQVPGYWREDIRAMVQAGIIAGDSPTDLGLTKQEAKAAVLLYRVMKKK